MVRQQCYLVLIFYIIMLVSSNETREKRDLEHIKNFFSGIFKPNKENCPLLKGKPHAITTHNIVLKHNNELDLRNIPVGVDILPYLDPQFSTQKKMVDNFHRMENNVHLFRFVPTKSDVILKTNIHNLMENKKKIGYRHKIENKSTFPFKLVVPKVSLKTKDKESIVGNKIINNLNVMKNNITIPFKYFSNQNSKKVEEFTASKTEKNENIGINKSTSDGYYVIKTNSEKKSTEAINGDDFQKPDDIGKKEENSYPQVILVQSSEPTIVETVPIKYSYKQKFTKANKTIEIANESNIVLSKVNDYSNSIKNEGFEIAKLSNNSDSNITVYDEDINKSLFKEPYIYNSRYIYKQKNSHRPNKFTIVQVGDTQQKQETVTNPPQRYISETDVPNEPTLNSEILIKTSENYSKLNNMEYLYIPPAIEQPLPSIRNLNDNNSNNQQIKTSNDQDNFMDNKNVHIDEQIHNLTDLTTEKATTYSDTTDNTANGDDKMNEDENSFRGDIPEY